MRLTVKTLFFIFSLTSFAYAVEVCTQPSTIGWTDDQKRKAEIAAYRLAFKNGQDITPKWNRITETLCFDDPLFNVSLIMTGPALLTEMALWETEVSNGINQNNNLRIELTDLQNQITSDYSNWDTLTTIQKLAVSKKVVRIQDLKKKLNE